MTEDRKITPMSDEKEVALLRVPCPDCGRVTAFRPGQPTPLVERCDGTWGCPHCGGPVDLPRALEGPFSEDSDGTPA